MVDKGTEWNLVRDVIDVVQMKSVYNQVLIRYEQVYVRQTDTE